MKSKSMNHDLTPMLELHGAVSEALVGPNRTPAEPIEAVVPSIDDVKRAFVLQTDGDLRRARLLFEALRFPMLVKMGPTMARLALKLRLPVKSLMKTYFFDRFCGGETLEETLKKADKMANFGVNAILDYGVEGAQNETAFNATAQEVIRTLTYAAKKKSFAFVALKATGLIAAESLERLQAGGGDKNARKKLRERMDAICAVAFKLEQPVLIDAEETWIQNEIDDVAELMMRRYNRDAPIVYTTLQHYRKDRLDYFKALYERLKARRAITAVKPVRGAYLEKETARAQKLGYPNPLNPSKKATDEQFDASIRFALERIGHVSIVAGTHNEQSLLRMAQIMRQLRIPANHPDVWISQLYGMSDNISFNFAAEGYHVAKYLPFGPLEAVLPYLFRRAEENSSIAGQTGRELEFIYKEIQRRKIESRKSKLKDRLTIYVA
jgi:proline dehydrogenase